MGSKRWSKRIVDPFAVMALCCVLGLATHARTEKRPNIVFILTDDQDVELFSLDYMPKLKSLISDQGVMFTRMYASVPVCCPSRSSLWSGRYQHNNGVKGNSISTNCSSKDWVL